MAIPVGEEVIPGVTVSQASCGEWSASLAERWNIGRNQNGGVLLSAVSAVLAASTGRAGPLTVTGHYLRPAQAAEAVIRASVVKSGRTSATGLGELAQDSRERLRVTGTFGDLAGRGEGPASYAEPPPLPSPEACQDLFDVLRRGPAGEKALTRSLRNFEIRVDPDTGWGPDGRGRPSLSGWIRYRDADTVTAPMIIAATDGFPPTLMSHSRLGWLPTLELTVHLFGLPRPGEPWLRASLRTCAVSGGLLDEDGEFWDAAGRLIARFRQLALLLPADG